MLFFFFLFFGGMILCRALWIRHRLLRTGATSISRLASLSRPSNATPRPSACVPKNRKVTCPLSTRTELQPTSSRFVSDARALQLLHDKMAARCFALLTACLWRQMKWTDVVADCSQAVEMNPRYIKALFRRARALERLDNKKECLEGGNQYFCHFSPWKTI